MQTVVCVECAGEIEISDDVMLGEVALCQDCGVELEITALAPLQVELAPEIEEDWGE